MLWLKDINSTSQAFSVDTNCFAGVLMANIGFILCATGWSYVGGIFWTKQKAS